MKCQIHLRKGNLPDKLFSKSQLVVGTRVEHEHTYSHNIAKQIAKAHLVEDPNYYKKLRKARL